MKKLGERKRLVDHEADLEFLRQELEETRTALFKMFVIIFASIITSQVVFILALWKCLTPAIP